MHRENPRPWQRKAATLVSKLEDPSAGETVKLETAEALCELLRGGKRIFGPWNAKRAYDSKCAHAQNVARDKLNARRIAQKRGEEDLRREALLLLRRRGIDDDRSMYACDGSKK